MKLILCKECQDVVRLVREKERFCRCRKCSGRYYDNLHAWYKGGEHVVPLSFSNESMFKAMSGQPNQGMGKDFSAFVIPKNCNTFEKIET